MGDRRATSAGRNSNGWPIFGRDVAAAAWRPSADLLADSRLARLLALSGEADLADLQRHAERDPAWFWATAVEDLALAWQRPFHEVVDLSHGPEWTRWWIGGAFNYAAAAVDSRALRDREGAALTWEGEDAEVRSFTNGQLKEAVDRAAGMLQAQGVAEGDRVGIFLPFVPETVISVLALGRIKAIYTPIFSGYGAPAVASRLADCGATVLITADGFLRRGSVVDLKHTADAAVALTPSIRRVIVVRRLDARVTEVPWSKGRDVWWDQAVGDPGLEPVSVAPETDPETPFMIIYTSGTTGRPKGAVHVHGGFP
ncbi:MAG: AMP-binding protein, partial [Chloroflexi bacterium]|nr:AMP-binding protein [Chloroflexota bacterium]